MFELDRERIAPPGRDPDGGGLLWKTLAILVLICAVGAGLIVFQEKNIKHYDFSKVYARFNIPPLPLEVLDAGMIDGLNRLTQEPCDSTAIFAIGKELTADDRQRAAADFYVGAANACGQDQYFEREAAGLYNAVKDYARERTLFVDLTARFPNGENDWYDKGRAEAALGRNGDALASYTKAIDLMPNKAGLGSWVFEEMAAIYAAQGRFCEAMSPIQTYISLGAERANDNTGRLLDDYAEKGHCDQQTSGTESFPVLDSDTVSVRATINGVAGTFIIDTGASFVSVNEDFANRADLITTGFAQTETANGKTTEQKGIAATVSLGSLKARNVPFIMLSEPLTNADGLLGRSFLSHFNMIFDRHQLKLTSKSPS